MANDPLSALISLAESAAHGVEQADEERRVDDASTAAERTASRWTRRYWNPASDRSAAVGVARRILRLRLSPFSDGRFDLTDAAQAHHATMWNGNHIAARNQRAAQGTMDRWSA
jgi:hypothetical protein